MDAKLARTTFLVTNGEGLKIPSSADLGNIYWVAYPPLLYQRRDIVGVDRINEELTEGWHRLQTYLGANFRSDNLRTAFRQGVEHMTDAMHNPAFPPHKARWRTLFHTSFGILHTILSASQTPRNADKAKVAWTKAFDDKNLVDIEETTRGAETEDTTQTAANTGPEQPNFGALLAALKESTRALADFRAQQPKGKGGRGGRGGQGH